MPDKDGDDDKKSTKSVVNKKQKQMLNQEDYLPEEGYDVARDQGRVRPSKDKKDATTMPVSKEMRKTQKVNKGSSALDVIKKKYKGQIMDELDLSKVAESFGGYITEVEIKGKGPIKKIVTDLKKKGKIDPEADTPVGNEISPNVQTSGTQKPKRGAKIMGSQRNIFTGKPELKTAKTTYNKPKKKLAPKPADGQLSLFDKPTPAMSGGKIKGTPKGPTLKPTTSGRKITKRAFFKSPKPQFQKDIETIRTDKGKKITTGEIGYTAPNRPEKIKKRMGRQGGDPFKMDTSRAAKDAAKDLGSKPVKGGLDFGKPGTGVKDFKFQPRDRSAQQAAEKTKKSLKTFGKDVAKAGADIGIEKNIARVDKGKKISKGADFSKVSRKTGAMKSGPKVVKQLGRTPKLGGSVLKVAAKETGEAAAKSAGKAALKKGAAKSLAKAVPGVGSMIAGGEAALRLAKGDVAGAALSAGEAIPGVGLGFAGANIARDVSRAKKAAAAVKTATKSKRVKSAAKAVKVVTPTVVGSTADKALQQRKAISQFAKSGSGAAVIGGAGALAGRGINKSTRGGVPAVRGGKVGRRSAGK